MKEHGQTVRQYLSTKGYSKHLLIQLKNFPGRITADGIPVPVHYELRTGNVLAVALEESENSPHIVPTAMNLDILYEDRDLLVVNKPAGLPVHPSHGHFEHTLANGMAWYFAEKGESFVFRAVNRLDRDTSGLLILARHALSASLLSQMVKNRSICRQYQAIAKGLLPKEGTVTAPIARLEGSVIERCVDYQKGDYACTHFRLLHYSPRLDCSLISLTLETGRTHQIRVHMKHIGHPIIGDFLYCPDLSLIKRQALHSQSLTFSHPITGEPISLKAPLPEDMRFILEDR